MCLFTYYRYTRRFGTYLVSNNLDELEEYWQMSATEKIDGTTA